jgi:hypothetical protein
MTVQVADHQIASRLVPREPKAEPDLRNLL